MADTSKPSPNIPVGPEHTRVYLETDGREGYYRDMSYLPEGGDPKSITLILQTIGRKSGRALLTPLLFNFWNDEFVIVASKGGSDKHPAWYLNLTAADRVAVQIRDKRYSCKWRVAEGAERDTVWKFMADYFPPYRTYQTRTERQIPVVVLTPTGEIKEKFVLGDAAGVNVK
jgi:deazaflavin-dependent oxidoreductase (nitroreductase family)